MRIAVIGAGALGCTFAALLDKAGHDVLLVARGAQLEAVRGSGLTLSGGFGDWRATRLVAAPTLEGPADLALLTVKAQDAAAALSEHGAALAGIPVLVVQNGLDGVRTAEQAVPESSCFGALSIIAASYLQPGSVTVTTPAITYLGRGSAEPDAEVIGFARVLGEAFPAQAIGNFVGAQWTKLVVNQLNALPAITGLSVQQVIANRGLRRVMAGSMQEAVRAGIARGIRFGSLQGLSDRNLRLFARLPITLAELLPLRFAARMGPVPNPGSTLQSLKRGQRTEIDFLSGAVAREAGLAGFQAPVNAALTALVHEVEQSGKFLSAAEVLARLPR